MDTKTIEEIKNINKLKSKYNCLTCEIVVPENFEEPPACIL